MSIPDSATHELAQLLGSGFAGELIPELLRQGPKVLIEALEAAEKPADDGRFWLTLTNPCGSAPRNDLWG